MLEVGSIAAIIGATVGFTAMIGGLLLKAFITPVKTRTDNNHEVIHDHESRLRAMETKVNTHSIHMENILKSIDKLVIKIDLLVTNRYSRATDREE